MWLKLKINASLDSEELENDNGAATIKRFITLITFWNLTAF